LFLPEIQPSCPDLIRDIHQRRKSLAKKMDCRVKPGNDEWKVAGTTGW
jgi:hypothetical protein